MDCRVKPGNDEARRLLRSAEHAGEAEIAAAQRVVVFGVGGMFAASGTIIFTNQN